jgi:serine/threonine protein phosphatase 1
MAKIPFSRPKTVARKTADRKTPKQKGKAELPAGIRLYAIGDVHGRRDLLGRMHALILADARDFKGQTIALYLGDFIDRGPDSAGVIDDLLAAPLKGFRTIHLMGNHEDMLLAFLEDASVGPVWLFNGGDQTLRSYGIEPEPDFAEGADLAYLQSQLRALLPSRHLKFLRALSLSFALGDYFFVHAGIRPRRPLSRQARSDLLWIRDQFLTSRADHGAVVVHGHTIAPEVEFCPNRIGIDTGAFFTGRLSCLVLEGGSKRVLQT